MRLKQMTCTGFRCIAKIDFAPGPAVNVIHGQNAQGKTSVLEAVLFAATSKSHRTNTETDLVRHGEEGFRIRLEVARADRDVTLETIWWQGDKRVKVNNVAQTRLSDILGHVRVVFFSPEDIALVKGSASVRRRFLDMELSQISPPYLAALQSYRQALRQRNELLRKSDRPDEALIDVWDEQLAQHGAVVVRERSGFAEQLQELAAKAYNTIATNEALELTYKPDIAADAFVETLRENRANDIRRKQTLHGPHRDDIDIGIEGQPARTHGSQGQQKSAALALKLAELELIHGRTQEYPILMLDEVLAELDQLRAAQLFEAIPSEVQCIITTTQPDGPELPANRESVNFRIEGGALHNES